MVGPRGAPFCDSTSRNQIRAHFRKRTQSRGRPGDSPTAQEACPIAAEERRNWIFPSEPSIAVPHSNPNTPKFGNELFFCKGSNPQGKGRWDPGASALTREKFSSSFALLLLRRRSPAHSKEALSTRKMSPPGGRRVARNLGVVA